MRILKTYYITSVTLILFTLFFGLGNYNGLFKAYSDGISLNPIIGVLSMLYGLSGVVLFMLSIVVMIFTLFSKQVKKKLPHILYSTFILLLGVVWTAFLLIQMNYEDHAVAECLYMWCGMGSVKNTLL